MKKHSDEITNDTVKSILHKRGFFDDLQWLSNILLPIKAAIYSLESHDTILADCYVALLQIALLLKNYQLKIITNSVPIVYRLLIKGNYDNVILYYQVLTF